mgnify:CR=1 FL=1
MAAFDLAIRVVLAHEGGLADNPNDPGGVTNFGISAKAYPSLGADRIRALTQEEAVAIYKRDWWDGRGYDQIRDQAVATKIFDMSVNMGFTTTVRLVQRALNYLLRKPKEVTADGVMGPETLGAINGLDPELLVLTLRAYHCLRYVELVEGPDLRLETFAKTWLRRAMA